MMSGIILAVVIAPLTAVYILVVSLMLDTSQTFVQFLLIIPVSYLLGSIPWGFLVTHLVNGLDVRKYGSGRIGMTNVLRLSGVKVAIPVLLMDMSKGVLVVLFARAISESSPAIVSVAAILVIVGHNWSIFLKFKGGRGIATGAGAAMFLLWPLGFVAFVAGVSIFTLMTFVTRYVSLGSLFSVIVVALVIFGGYIRGDASLAHVVYGIVGGSIIIWGHKDNIQRLRQGNERKLGEPAETITVTSAEQE